MKKNCASSWLFTKIYYFCLVIYLGTELKRFDPVFVVYTYLLTYSMMQSPS